MITINRLSVSFSGNPLFNNISLVIGDKDRIGLVGKNGAGKSTLLKILANEQEYDSGSVVMPSGQTLGYLRQELVYRGERSVKEEALTAFAESARLEKTIEELNQKISTSEDYESVEFQNLLNQLHQSTERLNMIDSSNKQGQTEKVLLGLGFLHEEMDRPVKEFSSGWQMRVELAKILLQRPDIILLDEPTNHLDINSIQWLENFLKGYFGAVVLVSHDRMFLDCVTNRTVEITAGKIYDYKCSYSDYVVLMEERREVQLAHMTNQKREVAEIEKFIERFRYTASKAKQVQSRVKLLEKMEEVQLDESDNAVIHFRFPPAPHSGKISIEIEALTKSYGNHVVLQDLDLIIEKGAKIAFVGRNGEGKSTLSKIIVGELEQYQGVCKLGHQVKIGYFAQNQAMLLDGEKTVFETIDEIAVGDIRTKIRGILGSFLFSGEDIEKKVKVLSGGEKTRLALAKLLLSPVNLLVLDEPTNHLDMPSKDILKKALLMFDGTLVLVSHDRDFLQGLTDMIYEFKDKKIRFFKGEIFDFLADRNIENFDKLNTKIKREKTPTVVGKENKESYQQSRKSEKKLQKQKKDLRDLEAKIADVESRIEEMNTLLADSERQQEIIAQPDFYQDYEKKKAEASQLFDAWTELQMEIDTEEKQAI